MTEKTPFVCGHILSSVLEYSQLQSSSLPLEAKIFPRRLMRLFIQDLRESFMEFPDIPFNRDCSFFNFSASPPNFASIFVSHLTSFSLHLSLVVGSHRLAGTLSPLIFKISMVKIKTDPPGIFGGEPRSP